MEIITRYNERIKNWIGENRADLLVGLLVLLISFGSFGLGRLSAVWKPHPKVRIVNPETRTTNQQILPSNAKPVSSFKIQDSSVVASKNGTAYHLPDCPGAKQIKSENMVTFKDAAAAKAAGYSPAGNCPALQP